ncbi:MAG: hypothetical protein SVS85_03615 [Candidatus Nanohaloarchaea archaeon]|nr:hypothetical protein [Candidatus Nanohaloarchaea archaeon]
MEEEQIEKNIQDLRYHDYLSLSNVALGGALATSVGILGLAPVENFLMKVLAATYAGSVLVAVGIRYRQSARNVRSDLRNLL